MLRCKNPRCGSQEIDFSEASGDAVCVVCGTVCEESSIVSSIEFSEGAGGSSSVVGQFVSASCTKPYGIGGKVGKARYGFLRSSRETTLATGRRKIAQVASSLRLGTYYVDGAHRLFAMAAQRNFTQGRKALHVACACLYVMCRREKSAHMLIDFSDVLQVNVYALGSTFLKFRRLLNLELPIIDPSLYIHRFAAKLELGDKAGAVSTTALRVVQRMRRDWIETGRRPAGVCAAALLIGARAHGFHRTQDDVVRALRVCGMTVSQRLADFQRTPAAQLSLEEFSARALELESEEHPPSYRRAQESKRMRITNTDTTQPGGPDSTTTTTPMLITAAAAASENDASPQQEAAATSVRSQDKESSSTAQESALVPAAAAGATSRPAVSQRKASERAREMSRAKEQLYSEIKEMLEQEGASAERAPSRAAGVARSKEPCGRRAHKQRRGDEYDEFEEEDGSDASDDDFDDVDDADIDGFILTEEEVAKKSKVWTKLNKDYLEQQDEKDKLARARAEAAGESYGDEQQQRDKRGGARREGGGKRKRGGGGGGARHPSQQQQQQRQLSSQRPRGGEVRTAREAVIDVAEKRRFSKKINYAALVGIFGDDSSLASGGGGDDHALPQRRQLVGGGDQPTDRARARLVADDSHTRAASSEEEQAPQASGGGKQHNRTHQPEPSGAAGNTPAGGGLDAPGTQSLPPQAGDDDRLGGGDDQDDDVAYEDEQDDDDDGGALDYDDYAEEYL